MTKNDQKWKGLAALIKFKPTFTSLVIRLIQTFTSNLLQVNFDLHENQKG